MITTTSLQQGTGAPLGARAVVVDRDIYDVFQYPGSVRIGRRLLFPRGAVVDRDRLDAAINQAAGVEANRAIRAYRNAHGIAGPTGSVDPESESITDDESLAVGAAAAQVILDGAAAAISPLTPGVPVINTIAMTPSIYAEKPSPDPISVITPSRPTEVPGPVVQTDPVAGPPSRRMTAVRRSNP